MVINGLGAFRMCLAELDSGTPTLSPCEQSKRHIFKTPGLVITRGLFYNFPNAIAEIRIIL